MFRIKLNRLIDEFGVKKNAFIDLIDSNRVDFAAKLKDNSFSPEEQKLILDKYGSLLK